MAVRMELESMTSAVVADMGFEPIREVLNIHLARLLASRLSTIRQSASDLFQVYSCIQGSILTDWTNAPIIYSFKVFKFNKVLKNLSL